jgi:hyperosmotically inducible protein
MPFMTALAPLVFAALLFTNVRDVAAQTPAGKPPSTTQSTPAQKDRTPGRVLTDAWITMKIHSQFVPEKALEGSEIDVDTRNGVVTLSGTVPTEAGRSRAIGIAKTTEGVKSVVDKQLRVATGAVGTSGGMTSDGWIKSKIYAQFFTDSALEDSDIDVDVAKGMVTLNGIVRTEAGRSRAVALAKATDGVKGVKDALKVTPGKM